MKYRRAKRSVLRFRKGLFIFILPIASLAFGSCSLVLDPSALALESNDKTLVHSACKAAPSQGLDICRVLEGSTIREEWDLIVPHPDKFISGEVRIRIRDTVKTYPVTDNVVKIPWKEVLGHEIWLAEDDGPVQALGSFQYKGPQGPVWVDILGIAFLVVLKQGYSPMPIDSGVEMSDTKCTVQYSSAGRSAILCSK